MLITKEQQEAWVKQFAIVATAPEIWAFTIGIDKALTEVAKGCIDKQVAIRFAQSLTNHEVTEQDLTEFLNNK
jgi:hypothetical protein